MMLYNIENVKWERSNIKCLIINKRLIKNSVEGSTSNCNTTKECLNKVAVLKGK
jgi:hypothetical protein